MFDALSFGLRALWAEIREIAVSIFLLSQGHRVLNYKAGKGLADWGMEDGDFTFDSKTMEITFKD